MIDTSSKPSPKFRKIKAANGDILLVAIPQIDSSLYDTKDDEGNDEKIIDDIANYGDDNDFNWKASVCMGHSF